ncbi:MAG: TRAP transporter small permease subunit [Alphaproteobacteria bacterium]|nr:TRAP transporter small permease subunit [Rhodospirillales bacterium]MCW9044757.1 TRAP transporter small permease subunit [Alphaproteobacteria bacterium]
MTDKPDDGHIHVAEIVEHMREHPDHTHVPIADAIDNFIRSIGHVVCWVNGLLIFIIILQVVLRYGFNSGVVMIEELQWHFYAIGVMFGVAYAQVNDAHIRVDILHMRLSDRGKRIVEIFGILFFILPFVFVVVYHSIDFVYESYRLNEHSDAPIGLPWRWLIKSVIPISFSLFGLAAISRLIRDGVVLSRGSKGAY